MFELSFGKMMIIAVVALIVLGPEKLPRVARTLGHLLGRARSYANQVKQDIDREMQMEELRKLQEQAKDAARSFETAVNDAGRSVEAEASNASKVFSEMESDYQSGLAAGSDPAAGNSIAPPGAADSLPTPAAAPASLTAQDEIDALEKSIAEQAQYAETASAAPSAKPATAPERMTETSAPPAGSQRAA